MERPLRKLDLLPERKHYGAFNRTSLKETNPYPVGQWPVSDHGRQRAHFKDWNGQSSGGGGTEWRPVGRYIAPKHQEPRESRVRHIPVPTQTDKGHFIHREHGHFDKHLKQSTGYDDYKNLQGKIRSAPAGRAGQEWGVEYSMGRKVDVPAGRRRNGIGVRNAGDKNYKTVGYSDKFHNYGAVIAHSDFGKISGSHNGELRRVHQKSHLGLSTRANDFGRSMQPKYLSEKVKTKKPYAEMMKEQNRLAEIMAVTDLPDHDTFHAAEEAPPVVEEPKRGGTSSRKKKK